MSGTTSSVTVAVDGFRPPFTAVQWQELEQQALIYKYLMAGLPVPTDLLAQIRRSLEALPARFFHHSALGYCSYYGKKFDPEPGRCRRTDGKKWRCSKDAYPDSKYCERHMHRGRNRSRKPVESQSTTQSLSTATSQIITGSSTTTGGSFQGRSSGSFQNLPLYPLGNTESQSYGTSKFQMETSTYGLNNKEPRYLQEMTPDAADYNFLSETSNSAKGLGMDCNVDNTWRLMSSQAHSSPSLEPRNYSDFQGNSTQSHLPQAYELDATKQRQQYCFFGNDIGSLGPVKQEQNLRHPFFEELPKTRDAWSHLDDDGYNKNTSSTTQLSISMAGSDYLSRSVCSPNDAL